MSVWRNKFFSVLAVIRYSRLRYCVYCVRSIGFDNQKITQMNFHFISLCIFTCDVNRSAEKERETERGRATKENRKITATTVKKKADRSIEDMKLAHNCFHNLTKNFYGSRCKHLTGNCSIFIEIFKQNRFSQLFFSSVHAIFLLKKMQKT